jgi:hypothetical protein
MQVYFADGAGRISAPAFRDRMVGAALVVLLHVALLAALMEGRLKSGVAPQPETILFLAPPSRAVPPPRIIPTDRSVRSARRPQVVPDYRPANAAPAPPDIRALGQALFGCDLENLNALSGERKSQCEKYRNAIGARVAHGEPNLLERPFSAGDVAWAESIIRRNTPVRVDCTHVDTQVQDRMQTTTAMVDIPCVIRHFMSGQGLVN